MKAGNQKQLHRKLFYTYMLVVVLVASGLMLLAVKVLQLRNYQINTENAERIQTEAVDYLADASEVTGYLYGLLYQSENIMKDLQNYLLYDSEEYIKRRLDYYSDSNSLQSENIYDFIEDAFSAYKNLQRIELVSYEKRDITFCFPDEKIYTGKKYHSRIDEILENGEWAENEFFFRKEIISEQEKMPVGCMVFVFDEAPMERLMKNQKMVELLVHYQSGKQVWGTRKYDREEFTTAEREGRLEEYTKAFVQNQSVQNYQIYVLLNKKMAYEINDWLFLAIIGCGAVLILVGELLVSWYLKRLNTRLNMILDGMEQVMNGNLTERLPVNDNGDELDVISSRFNEMCEKLDLYIQKSYLAEIEQKNAQMQVLQSQINPHFLYNTLEAIRMKAITNGDREVGKMLYSMAVTFRAQLKEKDVITLAQELHYCKKYLELFEYRYQNRFCADVDCAIELLKCRIIKFVLQPLIENYFVHGIRMEADDNYMKIWAEKSGENIKIYVEDNGRGMTSEEIREKNENLKKNIYEKQASIGLSNVNRRVKAVYGGEYGVQIEKSSLGGVCVILEIKYEEENQDENSDACRR